MPGVPRVRSMTGERPSFADFGGIMDGELARLDDADARVRADRALLARDAACDRALQVHFAAVDLLRLQRAASAEEPAGSAHIDLRPDNRGHTDLVPELNVNLAGFQGAAHRARTREMKLLRGRPAADVEAPSEVDLAALHVAADIHGAGAMNLLGLQAAV